MPWYEPEDDTPREQCPCCGFVSLAERGTSLICPVCFWEDDAFVGNLLDERSMCNKTTLRQARKNFARFGACSLAMLKNVVSVEERIHFEFRPLTDS